MTLLSGAARTPIKGRSVKLHFKSNGTNLKEKGSRAPKNVGSRYFISLLLILVRTRHYQDQRLDLKHYCTHMLHD